MFFLFLNVFQSLFFYLTFDIFVISGRVSIRCFYTLTPNSI